MKKRKTYSAKDIAKYIVDYSNEIGHPVDSLKLQKLLYFCVGFRFLDCDNPLISETFSGWRYGPAVPKVYEQYKIYGTRSIHKSFSEYYTEQIDADDQELIRAVVDKCKYASRQYLIDLTHGQKPWMDNHDEFNQEIPMSEIRAYFQENYDDSVKENIRRHIPMQENKANTEQLGEVYKYRDVIQNLILYISDMKRFSGISLNDQGFINHICNITGMSEKEYKKVWETQY